jgi:hypothetical protein
MESSKLWARHGEAVRQDIELGELGHHLALSRWSCNCLRSYKSDYECGWQSISAKFRSGNDLSATEIERKTFSLVIINSLSKVEYYIANEITETYKGMILAIPDDEWRVFGTMSTAELVVTLLALARHVRLQAFRKHPRGSKKPPPTCESSAKPSHVSTARFLMNRKANPVTP